jgi:hypothetical protein
MPLHPFMKFVLLKLLLTFNVLTVWDFREMLALLWSPCLKTRLGPIGARSMIRLRTNPVI